MLGLKIFVWVQTFLQRPLALSRNFCHPESDYHKSALWHQLLASIWLVPPLYYVSLLFVYCDYFKPAVSLLTSRLAYSSPSILFVLYDCKKWKSENVFKGHERCQPYGKRENVSKFCQRSLRGDVQPWDCACVHQHLEEGVQSKQCQFLRATQRF